MGNGAGADSLRNLQQRKRTAPRTRNAGEKRNANGTRETARAKTTKFTNESLTVPACHVPRTCIHAAPVSHAISRLSTSASIPIPPSPRPLLLHPLPGPTVAVHVRGDKAQRCPQGRGRQLRRPHPIPVGRRKTPTLPQVLRILYWVELHDRHAHLPRHRHRQHRQTCAPHRPLRSPIHSPSRSSTDTPTLAS